MATIKITSEYQEDIELFKKERIQQINEEVVEDGRIEPMIHLLCKTPDEPKLSVALIPIPGPLLNSDEGKELLTKQVIPVLLQKLTEAKLFPICLSFATEGWCWEGKAENKDVKLDYQRLKETTEKKEVVMLSFENELSCTGKIFYKKGTKVNDDGEVIEGAYLVEKSIEPGDEKIEMSGRFTQLFRKPIMPN